MPPGWRVHVEGQVIHITRVGLVIEMVMLTHQIRVPPDPFHLQLQPRARRHQPRLSQQVQKRTASLR